MVGVPRRDDHAIAHDQDAVAEHQQLLHLRRDDDDADARGREPGENAVDLILGANVDATRRLVADQYSGARMSTRPSTTFC